MEAQIKLRKVEARWVSLATPNTKFGDPGKYEITVVLPAEQAQDLLSKGANVKNNDGEYTLAIRNPSAYPSGDVAAPPPVVDMAMAPLPIEQVKKIGNGTIVNVNVTAKPYDVGGNKGTSFRIQAVQVVELKEYVAGNALDFADAESSF